MLPSTAYQVYWLDEDAVQQDGSWDMSFICVDVFGTESAAIQFARSVSGRNAIICKIVRPDGREIIGADLDAALNGKKAIKASPTLERLL